MCVGDVAERGHPASSSGEIFEIGRRWDEHQVDALFGHTLTDPATTLCVNFSTEWGHDDLLISIVKTNVHYPSSCSFSVFSNLMTPAPACRPRPDRGW